MVVNERSEERLATIAFVFIALVVVAMIFLEADVTFGWGIAGQGREGSRPVYFLLSDDRLVITGAINAWSEGNRVFVGVRPKIGEQAYSLQIIFRFRPWKPISFQIDTAWMNKHLVVVGMWVEVGLLYLLNRWLYLTRIAPWLLLNPGKSRHFCKVVLGFLSLLTFVILLL